MSRHEWVCYILEVFLALLCGLILWPGTALDTAKDTSNILFIKCFNDYPTVEESPAFMFHSSMEDLQISAVGNSLIHYGGSRRGKIESHAVLGEAISPDHSPRVNDLRSRDMSQFNSKYC